ncbi:hypothetical protein DL96DRAFT_1821978 [Flagelloscypha sp. PMI_526]|nr:hypothetical protein DL96DRAFT_1821978 [Flagelloscypha sp. PMI_526]
MSIIGSSPIVAMDEGTKERLTLTLEQARSDSNGILIDEYRRSRGLPNYAFYSISNAFPSNEGPGKRGGWVNLEDFHLFLLEKASGSIGIGVHVPAVAPRYDSTGSFDKQVTFLLGENEVVQPVAPVQASVPASRPRKKPQCSDSPSPTTSDNEFTPPPMKRPKTVQHQSLHKPGPLSSAGGHGALQPAEKPRIMSSNIPSSTTPSNQAVFKVASRIDECCRESSVATVEKLDVLAICFRGSTVVL